MPRITITENGVDKVITDIAPYRSERDEVLAQLNAVFADFEKVSVSALDAREGEIVDLVNRYNELTNILVRFEDANTRRDNILAGWEIVKQHRGGESA